MKKIIFGLLVLNFTSNVQSQTSAQLDINNINATVNTIYGDLFRNSNYSAGFEAPKGSGRTSIYSSGLWIGGQDINGQLHLGAKLFQDRDFIPGPIMDFSQYASQIPQWNRVWKINRADVLAFDNWWTSQQGSFIIPSDWLSWPAHGDTTLGQAQNLAPFFDRNSDGIYDILDGDYPLVPGDECIYYIFNDDTTHTGTGGDRMKIEVNAFVYAFNCPSDSALQNTIFVKYKIVNRSTATYYNTSVGVFTDTDLGGAIDDYIGCNVQKGSYYVYNGDNSDENYQGTLGYGDSLASQAIVFLAGPYQDADGLDNPLTTNMQDAIDSLGIPYPGLGLNYGDGINDNERMGMTGFVYFTNSGSGGNPAQTDPANSSDFFNYLSGRWKDGTNMYYGGSGHLTSPDAIALGLTPCNYMFPGDSDPFNWGTEGVTVPTWDEISSGNSPNDRRGVGISGPFTFAPGQSQELDLAYVFARDCINLNNANAPIQIMNERIDSVRNYFIAQQTPCYTFNTYTEINEQNEIISFEIFPNPATNNFNLNYNGTENNLNYSIHDILGKEITSGQLNSIQTQIDCANWSKGVYLVRISGENEYMIKKIIVE